MKRRVSLMGLVLVLAVGTASAQWTKSLGVNTSYDANAFRNYQGMSDYATRFSWYLAKDGGGETWQSRFFYRGSFILFAQYDERNYHAHRGGLALSRRLGENGDVLNFGLNAGLRANGELYDYYNFKEVSAYGNVKWYAGVASIVQLGYKLRARSYDNLPELTYAEHTLFGRYTHFLPTKTTVMLEANLGRKQYRQTLTQSGTFPGSEDGGYGRHRGGMGHMGRGLGDMHADTGTQAAVSQLVAQLRLAQSLTSTTGLSVDLLLRRNPGDGIRYLAGQVSGYTTEDELFDDRYGYESEELAGTLTQLLPWNLTLKAGFEARWKDYVNRPALDLNGEPLPTGELRRDRQVFGWLTLSKSFDLHHNRYLDFIATFDWVDNRSNDPYYAYRGSVVSVGVSTSF